MYCIPIATSNSSSTDSSIPSSTDKNDQQEEPFVVLIQIIGNKFGIYGINSPHVHQLM